MKTTTLTCFENQRHTTCFCLKSIIAIRFNNSLTCNLRTMNKCPGVAEWCSWSWRTWRQWAAWGSWCSSASWCGTESRRCRPHSPWFRHTSWTSLRTANIKICINGVVIWIILRSLIIHTPIICNNLLGFDDLPFLTCRQRLCPRGTHFLSGLIIIKSDKITITYSGKDK